MLQYLSIDDGKLNLYTVSDEAPTASFSLDREGALAFIDHVNRTRDFDFQCSSSLDFPQESGAPEGWTFEGWITGEEN